MQLTYESKGTNTFLVYTMEEDEVLDGTSLGMLENNRIKGVLPLQYSQKDAQRYIKYNVSAKVSLSQYLKGVVNKARLVWIMSSLADAVMNAEAYMLEASAFLWDKEYIFVDAGTAEACLVCIPEEGRLNSKVDLEEFFRRVVMGVTFDSSENCDYVAKLIGFFNSNANFSLSEFSRTLKEIGNGSGNAPEGARVGSEPAVRGPMIMPVLGKTVETGFTGQRSAEAGRLAEERPEKVEAVPPDISLPGGGSIPGGSSVSVKSKEPAEKKGFSLFKNIAPKGKADKQDKENRHNKKEKQDKKGKKKADNIFSGMSIPGQGMSSNDDRTEVLDDRTEILDDETEILGQDIVPGIWLELLNAAMPGVTPRIDLNFGKPFITLGRLSSDENQLDIAFPRELKKIGRQHARIERRGSEFYVVDLGSANHTMLDDRILTPNQPYLLKEGMELAFTTSKLVSYRVHTM